MKRVIAAVAIFSWVAPVAAEPRKVMVLPSDGRIDAKVRAKIDAAILKLSRTLPDTVSPGEVSYNDLAAAVGCVPDAASCKDEVINTLAVDEIVISKVAPKPGGVEITVLRARVGSPPRDASAFVALDKVDKLDALAPLFGARTAGPSLPVAGPSPRPAGPPPGPEPAPAPSPAITTTPPPPAGEPPVTRPPPDRSPEPTVTAEPAAPAPPVAEPGSAEDRGDGRRRLRIAGMAAGGAMAVVGIVFWGQADNVQREIDAAPTRSTADLRALQDLEAKGDRFAAWGNVFAIGGLVLGGVSTYFFLKGRRTRRATHAQLAPALFDHGAGIALTIGGSP